MLSLSSEKPHARNFSARNSGARNGCAKFTGAWHFWLANPHAHKIPCCRVFCFCRGVQWGWNYQFIFMGVGFLSDRNSVQEIRREAVHLLRWQRWDCTHVAQESRISRRHPSRDAIFVSPKQLESWNTSDTITSQDVFQGSSLGIMWCDVGQPAEFASRRQWRVLLIRWRMLAAHSLLGIVAYATQVYCDKEPCCSDGQCSVWVLQGMQAACPCTPHF